MNKHIKKYLNIIKQSSYTIKTKKTKKIILENFDKFLTNNNIVDITDFNNSELIRYKKYVIENITHTSSFSSYNKSLKAFFNYLIKEKIIEENCFETNKKNKKLSDDFKKYYKEYFDEKIRLNSPKNTVIHIRTYLELFFQYLMEQDISKIEMITKEDIKNFLEHITDIKREDGSNNYKVVSINRIICYLKDFFIWLEENKVIFGILSSLTHIRDMKTINRNILSRKEISNLFLYKVNNLFEFGLKTIFVCQYASGLRISELLDLKLSNIDFENKVLLIYESKTRKERYVHIGDVGLNYLRIYIEYARDKINRKSKNIDFVFISNCDEKKIRIGTINTYLKLFCKKIMIDKVISTHCFRHSYGSHLLENGADIKIVSELLGHKDLTSTERYTRLSPERLRIILNEHHPRERNDKL